ncbi:hypothetical protein JCM10212_006645, partial [Sporobolomyces blumeae]
MHLPAPQDVLPLALESIAAHVVRRSSSPETDPGALDPAALDLDPFELSHAQWIKVYWIEAVCVAYLLGWNLWIARSVLFPLKLVAVALHECCHAIVGTITGGKITSVVLDPNQGGATTMAGGVPFFSLPAGYIGSTTIGSLLIFASFDLKASKIASIPLFGLLFLVSWWARKSRFTLINIHFISGLLVLAFFVSHSAFLPFFLITQGVMNVMVSPVVLLARNPYSVFDQIDDLVLHKINASDVCAFHELYPWIPAQAWGLVWTLFSLTG